MIKPLSHKTVAVVVVVFCRRWRYRYTRRAWTRPPRARRKRHPRNRQAHPMTVPHWLGSGPGPRRNLPASRHVWRAWRHPPTANRPVRSPRWRLIHRTDCEYTIHPQHVFMMLWRRPEKDKLRVSLSEKSRSSFDDGGAHYRLLITRAKSKIL